MTRRARILAWVTAGLVTTAILAAVACSTTLQGSLAIVTGPDNGFTMDPRPTTLLVQLTNPFGGVTNLGRFPLASDGGITLPPQPSTGVDILTITGLDDAGDAVVSGRTIPLALDQLNGLTLDLFVQRTGQFSRLPSGDGGTAVLTAPTSAKPLLTTLYSRYLLIADGTGKTPTAQLYDTLTWQVDPSPPPLPLNPLSVAFVGTYTGSDAAIDGSSPYAALLALGPNGAATWVNLGASSSTDAATTVEASAPTGSTFAEVAGGQTVVNTDDGSLYIVGGTRLTGGATNQVLHISPSGLLQWIALDVPRLGAAATYAPTVGLYVFGGNPTSGAGAGGPGAELVPSGGSTALKVGTIPADTTTGAGAVALDPSHVVLAGGVGPKGTAAPVRLISFPTLKDGGGIDAGTTSLPRLPVTFKTAQAFRLVPATDGGFTVMLVGTESSGRTLAYSITADASTPVPFRVARSHAQAVLLPNGSLAVIGGDAATMESFIP